MRNLRQGYGGRCLVAGVSVALATVLGGGAAAAKDIKVCLIAGKTGALEAYARGEIVLVVHGGSIPILGDLSASQGA